MTKMERTYNYLDEIVSKGIDIYENRQEIVKHIVTNMGIIESTARHYISLYLTRMDIKKKEEIKIIPKLFVGQAVRIESLTDNGHSKKVMKGKIEFIQDRFIGIRVYINNKAEFLETFNVADLIDNKRRVLKIKDDGEFIELNLTGISLTNKFSNKELMK